ncbi:uncharacterized protein rrp8 [Engraulis encrasicolus]|uniref:uncharacterized protein rrp8 n=1 Tax=Engraulis encrasicolus TaxID=184585 RepID=UPI002FD23527
MFAEEEWTDAPSAETVTQCAPEVHKSGKENVAGKKKSLLKTLQTLGSGPDWNTCSAPKDSDSETEAPTSHPKKKKKKKRNRKRKRDTSENAQAEGGDGQDADIPKPIKKQKKQQKAKGVKKVKSAESVSTEEATTDKESKNSMEKPLSRKQWRMRIKNKKRCKNKYQDKSLQTPKSETKQVCEIKKPLDENDTSKSPEETAEVNNVKSKKAKKAKEKRKEKASNKGASSVSLTSTEDVAEESVSNISKGELDNSPEKPTETLECSNITKCDVDTNLIEPLEKTETLKPSDKRKQKEKQMRAEKLRKILNSQLLDAQMKKTEDKEESTEKETEEEEDEAVTKNEAPTLDRSSALRSKMEKRLEAARFRYINEQLYTTTSKEAKKMFKEDPKAFEVYHLGFTTQVQYWPQNPVDAIISFIRQKPASLVVADFGCGDCKIARSVKNKVHSFDLAPTCDLVTVCDMAKVPLADETVDIAVFCLSLMGTNLADFLSEANRVLAMGGILKIAEVASRFENVRAFTSTLSNLGFKIASKDTKNNYFFLFEFIKVGDVSANAKKTALTLKPCVYKKR